MSGTANITPLRGWTVWLLLLVSVCDWSVTFLAIRVLGLWSMPVIMLSPMLAGFVGGLVLRSWHAFVVLPAVIAGPMAVDLVVATLNDYIAEDIPMSATRLAGMIFVLTYVAAVAMMVYGGPAAFGVFLSRIMRRSP